MLLQADNIYKSYYVPDKKINCFVETVSDKEKFDVSTFTSPFAVKDISLKLNQSEIISILGSNGSGKSTLLKMLAGQLKPDSGTVKFKNKDVYPPVTKLIPSHDGIKLIHQDLNLFPNISIEENIAYNLRFHTKEFQQKKLVSILKLCNLVKVKDKIPKKTSGGEQQRTAIATALASDAQVLLFDEPFSNLDVFNRTELRAHIKQIASKSKIGIVFVTHDGQDALAISNKLIIMKEGRFIQIDTPENIYSFPLSAYAAQISGLTNILTFRQLRFLALDYNLKNRTGVKFNIRPEDIYISTDEISDWTVVNSIYMGDSYLLQIKMAEEITLFVKTPQPFILDQRVCLKIDYAKISEVID